MTWRGALRWLVRGTLGPSRSEQVRAAGEVVAAGFAAGLVAPPLPPLTAEEVDAARRVPAAPVPDWCGRSPLAEKARRRRQRRWLARIAWCG